MKKTTTAMVYCFAIAVILIVIACGTEPPSSFPPDCDTQCAIATTEARMRELRMTAETKP